MKRFMVLVVGLAFMFSTVAFAADEAPKGKKKDKAVVEEKAPAAAADTAATPEKPATDAKAEKKSKKAKKE